MGPAWNMEILQQRLWMKFGTSRPDTDMAETRGAQREEATEKMKQSGSTTRLSPTRKASP